MSFNNNYSAKPLGKELDVSSPKFPSIYIYTIPRSIVRFLLSGWTKLKYTRIVTILYRNEVM